MSLQQGAFRARLLPTLIAAALFALLLKLGFWQLDRARQKEEIFAESAARAAAAPLQLDAGATPAELLWRRVQARGRYLPAPQYLLDNQVHAGRPGYQVYAVFETADRVRVLVARGWVAADPDRRRAPTLSLPSGEMELAGSMRPPPRTPVLMETPPEQLAPGVLRVQQIDPARFGAELPGLLPYELRLAGSEPGFERDWPAPGSGAERHRGYAFQWFALAGTLAIIWLVLGLRRRRSAG